MRRPALLVAAAFLAATASAASPVGTWTGRIEIKMPPMPANTPPEQKAMMTKMMAQFKSAKIILNLKANKTYTVTTVGIPTKKANEGGTWSQSGNTVTLTEKKGRAQKMELSKDGKTMVLNAPNGQGKVVFKR